MVTRFDMRISQFDVIKVFYFCPRRLTRTQEFVSLLQWKIKYFMTLNLLPMYSWTRSKSRKSVLTKLPNIGDTNLYIQHPNHHHSNRKSAA